MIPILYDSTETQFRDDIICHLGEATECVVTEEINGGYECEFKYPVWGKYFSEITEGRYIGATHNDKSDVQPFEIYKRSAPINGMVTFYAHHLSYKASRIILGPIDGNSPVSLFSAIPSHCINQCPFTFTASRGGSEEFEITVPVSLRSALIGKKDSILATYGGEYTFDKWQITLQTDRGVDTDITIRYGKNLTGLEWQIDAENLYNAVVPYWSGKIEGVDVLVTVEGTGIVALEGTTDIKPAVLDLSQEFKEAPESEDLEEAALAYLQKNKPWEPKENITVNFVHLWQTDEYQNVAVLQRVGLGDKLSVYYPELGLIAKDMEVVKTVYNTLLDRYDSMEIGSAKDDFVSNVSVKAKEDIEEKVEMGWTVFEERWRLALEELTYNMLHPGESHVVFYRGDLSEAGMLSNIEYGTGAMPDPAGILIMDNTNPGMAQKVLMINKNGIAYSENGVNGPFVRGWDMSTGKFTTEYINAWELMVNQIRLYGLMSVHENPQAVYVEGVLQDPIGGYIGYGKGRVDSNTTTAGIMLSSTNNLDGSTPSPNNRYVIVTTAGTRMQAGDQAFYLTDNLVEGSPAGNANLKVSNNFIIDTGGKIQIVKNGVTHDAYTGPLTGSSGTNYEIQIGNGNLKIVNGLIVNATAWTDYQTSTDGLLDLIHDNDDDIAGHESRISGNEQGIANLVSALANKADASALTALASRVSALENGSNVAVFG